MKLENQQYKNKKYKEKIYISFILISNSKKKTVIITKYYIHKHMSLPTCTKQYIYFIIHKFGQFTKCLYTSKKHSS